MIFNYQVYTLPHELPPGDAVFASRADVWGAFAPLFGMNNNALIVVSSSDERAADYELTEQIRWEATVRPATTDPLTKPGLYVFRHFAIDPDDADELVAHSQAAWETFETDSEFATQPVALFRPTDVKLEGEIEMMLVTWYDGFASWETSRSPDPEARAHFAARRRLLKWTRATATRLLVR